MKKSLEEIKAMEGTLVYTTKGYVLEHKTNIDGIVYYIGLDDKLHHGKVYPKMNGELYCNTPWGRLATY